MAPFCTYEVKNDVFILSLTGSDAGHNYLTEQSLRELKETLATIRRRSASNRPSSTPTKGLVTTCARVGSFCDGVDYASTPRPADVGRLARAMAEVVRELLEMPFPTVAAVGGDVRTSLGLALVLAHDSAVMLDKAKVEVNDLCDGHDAGVPPYVGALLRDKASYPQIGSELVLRSVAMEGFKMRYWWLTAQFLCGRTIDVENTAITMLDQNFCDVRDGLAYVTTRKNLMSFESWKAVSDFLNQ